MICILHYYYLEERGVVGTDLNTTGTEDWRQRNCDGMMEPLFTRMCWLPFSPDTVPSMMVDLYIYLHSYQMNGLRL